MTAMSEMENVEIKLEPQDYLEQDASNEVPPTPSPALQDDSTYSEMIEIKTEPSEMQQEMVSEYMCPQSNEIKQEADDSLDAFCFESDHPALKYNSDYKQLMKTMAILEAQKSKAIKDLDRLYELQEEALADPIRFVERLQRKENIDIPGPQKIYPIPVIDWNKYSLSGGCSAFGRRQLTRLSTKATQDLLRNGSKGKSGRMVDQKPKISQYWTAEEQKRLEELLVQFPPEEIESRRWEKIANCLENRTPIQVASRVQKYFIKLMKAGIPIPGRMPSVTYLRKPRRNVIRQQPSTFLVSHTLPVYMPEEDNDYSFIPCQSPDENSMESRVGLSDDEEISSDLKDTVEFKELMLLKKVQKEKLQTTNLMQHIGFKCCRCKMDPIVGVRWHCTECKPPFTVDFCEECAESMHEIGQHTALHKLEEINQVISGFQERDYMHFLGNDYNYLDPNYMPAT